MATALYNKYRPQVFEDVVGQEHIARTLKNAIASDKTSHSYLFTGPRGTGKTTTARLFSKALQCEHGPTPDPDGTCEECELIARGEHPDVYELDAASRTGVENVREEIIGKVQYAPTRGRCKVYIIDEVHMLSTAAFNALLKTLEEPPDHVIFILCTTDPQKVPETILSRCQRFDFRRISSEEMISRLGAICEMEGVDFEGDALDLVAHRADGGMRDALTSLDQLIAFSDGAVTLEVAERLLGSMDSTDLAEIVDAIGKRDAARCFRWTAEYMETGADLVQFVQDLTAHMRDMYVMSLAGSDVPLEVTEAARKELEAELPMFGPERLARALDVLNSLGMELKTSTNQRLSFEVSLTRLVRAQSDLTIDALSERVEELERMLSSGAPARTMPAPQRSAGRGDAGSSAPQQAQAASAPWEDEGPSGGGAPWEDDASGMRVDPVPADRASDRASATSSGSLATPPWEEGDDSAQAATIAPSAIPIEGSEDLDMGWESAQAQLKRIGAPYAVIFMGTTVHMDGDVLVIGFDPGKDFAFKASQKPESKAALEEALAKTGIPHGSYRIEMRERRAATDAANSALMDPPRAASDAGSSHVDEVPPTVSDSFSSQAAQNDHAAQWEEPPVSAAEGASPEPPHDLGMVDDGVSSNGYRTADEPMVADGTVTEDPEPVIQDDATIDIADDAAGDEVAPATGVAADPGLSDMLASAFGEGIVIEEIED